MVSKSARRIKLSKNMRPFVSRVVRDGAVQRAFAAQIGSKVGGCVAGAVRKGMTGGAIHDAVRDCAKGSKGTKLSIGGGRRGREVMEVTEVTEIE